ncbi:hypothetical protein [Candidatus Enterovibrio escicola]|uniref:Mobile element protein n=1 Tax=Candidatus Enterovibrio escicola TaxID=1927127 RepID=A0A2A5T717_9GAMM|nr:hypothetical protein [Candidatus Enterovibrio escacola]PCS23947.1 Mobile element protein [Candidatus Enterovibrio escacola]
MLSPKFTLRNYNTQVSETQVNIKAMNKIIRLDIPVQQQRN